MGRLLIILISSLICHISADLDTLLALSDESDESSEPLGFTPLRIVDASKPVHQIKIVHCTLCSSFRKNAILICKAVFDENPGENFNATFAMKNGKNIKFKDYFTAEVNHQIYYRGI